jgi:hypothetical protein
MSFIKEIIKENKLHFPYTGSYFVAAGVLSAGFRLHPGIVLIQSRIATHFSLQSPASPIGAEKSYDVMIYEESAKLVIDEAMKSCIIRQIDHHFCCA